MAVVGEVGNGDGENRRGSVRGIGRRRGGGEWSKPEWEEHCVFA